MRPDAVVVRFSSDAARQDALAQLGGGIRGKFRIVRERPPPAATAASASAAAAPRLQIAPANIVDGAQPRSNGAAAAGHDEWQTVAPRARPQGAFVPPHCRLVEFTDG